MAPLTLVAVPVATVLLGANRLAALALIWTHRHGVWQLYHAQLAFQPPLMRRSARRRGLACSCSYAAAGHAKRHDRWTCCLGRSSHAIIICPA